MPRYPGLVRSPINVDMSPLASYLGQNALADKEIAARKALSTQEFEQAKQLRGVDTTEAIKLRQFELDQQALANVLKREGMPEEQIQRVIASHANEKENQQKFQEIQAGQRRFLGENEPEVLHANEKALLRRPGLENKALETSTTRGDILNQTLSQREQAEIEGLKLGNETTRARLPAAGIISLPPGINMNVPSGDTSGAYNIFNVTPFERPQPGGMEFTPDPNDPSKLKIVPRPTIPAQQPSIFPMGTLTNLSRPTTSTTTPPVNTMTPDASGYIYRTDPATGKLMKARVRNP